MLLNNEIASKVAEFLLQVKAVTLSPEKPYTWASGWKSPIYCDNRITLSHPTVRTYIRQKFAHLIGEEYGGIDAIAGVATGGIAHGALVAEELGLPFIYVRAAAKEHGKKKTIDGELQEGWKVFVIEDLISTGKSSLEAVAELKKAGAKVVGLAAIFTYGFQISEEAFAKAKCPFFTLTDYKFLLEIAKEKGYLNPDHLDALHLWRQSPQSWKQNA